MRWWGGTARISIDIRDQSIPRQWLLEQEKLPSEDVRSVLNVPAESGRLTAEEIEMTNSDIESLLEAYRTRKWTVRQVITAFLKKAVMMDQMTNFVTEFLEQDAINQAYDLDAHLAKTGTLIGPLHGIPISVAEPIPLAGRITHTGIVSRVENPKPTEDARLVRQLKQAGAVIHLRTNVNQALIGLGCENNIMGQTLNPLDRRLSPGGPCGGEGVSIGSGCAVLGVGADVGVPAAFGGCYGFKPTAARVPAEWAGVAVNGEERMGCMPGPVARSVEGLQAWMKTVLDQDLASAPLSSVPWRSNVDLGDFTVGAMWTDGIVKPNPPVLRALKTAADRLRAAGVEVVEWEAYDHARGYDMLGPLRFSGGSKNYLAEFDKSGEGALRTVVHAFREAVGKQDRPVTGPEASIAVSQARESYQQEHDTMMAKRGVDFILSPAYVGAGVVHDYSRYSHYTSIWNILDLPSVVLPSGLRCDKAMDVKDETFVPRTDYNVEERRPWTEKEMWRLDVDQDERRAYNPKLFDGFPIALQLTGKRLEDEELLAAAGVLDNVLKGGSRP